MENNKKTLVIGASENPGRYSNMAIVRLTKHGHEVVAIGQKAGQVAGIFIDTDKKPFSGIHTITLYVNPTIQTAYYDYIVALHPKRLIFNPGTENDELEKLAADNGIETLEACTLVMLGTGQF